jgi:uncharacterized protein YijF (DUF1287 family)
MALQIDIEDKKVFHKTSKQNKPYYIQEAHVHTVDRNGEPRRYPELINIFLQKDERGNPIPHEPGKYELAKTSFQVRNGYLELGFVNLIPLKK